MGSVFYETLNGQLNAAQNAFIPVQSGFSYSADYEQVASLAVKGLTRVSVVSTVRKITSGKPRLSRRFVPTGASL